MNLVQRTCDICHQLREGEESQCGNSKGTIQRTVRFVNPLFPPIRFAACDDTMSVSEKKQVLLGNIRKQGSMLVAFSGGVDSPPGSFTEGLGERARCVLLDSPVVPRSAVEQAEQMPGTGTPA